MALGCIVTLTLTFRTVSVLTLITSQVEEYVGGFWECTGAATSPRKKKKITKLASNGSNHLCSTHVVSMIMA